MIDALVVDDVRPFWQAVVDGGHETIVHAGRGEMEFCLRRSIACPRGFSTCSLRPAWRASSIRPATARWFSSSWASRPKSTRPVPTGGSGHSRRGRSTMPCRTFTISGKSATAYTPGLEELGRLAWMEEETAAWCEALCHARPSERWRRVSGNSGLERRSLAIVHELWKWREGEAQRRNQPARRVLRDDLIIELAKRQTADVERIRAVRGMERGDLLRRMDDLAACIQRALALPADEWPHRRPGTRRRSFRCSGSSSSAALGSVCRQARLAPNLVGGPNDIRDWIVWRLAAPASGYPESSRRPKLAAGWRAEFVGRLFEDLLSGKTAVRIGDPASESPLVLEG